MFGIGDGPSKQENQQYNNLSGTSTFANNTGMGDITQSGDFMKSILSGDPTKIGQVLEPQIKAIQGQGQQSIQTASQFGNRGGGTNAGNQQVGDKVRGGVNDLISSLTGSAVSGLNSTGQNLLSLGMQGNEAGFNQANVMQQQNQKKWNDIFGSIGSLVAPIPGVGGFASGVLNS